jgi:hypothetical protein
MNTRFDILCNHCGSKVTLQPFETQVVCRNCQTYLKVEETETTLSTIIIDEEAFTALEDKPTIYDKKGYKNIQFLRDELQCLEVNWELEQEDFKINSVLPQRKRSLIWLFVGLITALLGLYGLLFLDNFVWVLSITGISWVYQNSREFYKFRKYKEAEEDFLDEKDRLEYEILLLER